MARKLRIRPNPVGSFFGGILALVFVGIGVFFVIPNAGAFGVFWTLMAVIGAVTSFYNAFSDRGIATEIVEVDDDGNRSDGGMTGTRSTEARLHQLDQLRARGVVTAEEHERRRAEILREI